MDIVVHSISDSSPSVECHVECAHEWYQSATPSATGERSPYEHTNKHSIGCLREIRDPQTPFLSIDSHTVVPQRV